MKKVLLLLVPFLLSQCGGNGDVKLKEPERQSTERRGFSKERLKELEQQYRKAQGKALGLVQVAALEQMPAELLKLLKQHENDPLPLEGLSTEESQKICDIDGAVLGWIAILNVSIREMSHKQYLHHMKKMERDIARNAKNKSVVQILQRALEIMKEYENGPFPLKPIPTRELEEAYYKSYLDWSVRTFYNYIAWQVGTSRENLNKMIKDIEKEVNRKASNAH